MHIICCICLIFAILVWKHCFIFMLTENIFSFNSYFGYLPITYVHMLCHAFDSYGCADNSISSLPNSLFRCLAAFLHFWVFYETPAQTDTWYHSPERYRKTELFLYLSVSLSINAINKYVSCYETLWLLTIFRWIKTHLQHTAKDVTQHVGDADADNMSARCTCCCLHCGVRPSQTGKIHSAPCQ